MLVVGKFAWVPHVKLPVKCLWYSGKFTCARRQFACVLREVLAASKQVNLPVFTGKLHVTQVNCARDLFTFELQVKLPAFAGNFARASFTEQFGFSSKNGFLFVSRQTNYHKIVVPDFSKNIKSIDVFSLELGSHLLDSFREKILKTDIWYGRTWKNSGASGRKFDFGKYHYKCTIFKYTFWVVDILWHVSAEVCCPNKEKLSIRKQEELPDLKNSGTYNDEILCFNKVCWWL